MFSRPYLSMMSHTQSTCPWTTSPVLRRRRASMTTGSRCCWDELKLIIAKLRKWGWSIQISFNISSETKRIICNPQLENTAENPRRNHLGQIWNAPCLGGLPRLAMKLIPKTVAYFRSTIYMFLMVSEVASWVSHCILINYVESPCLLVI